MPHSSLAAHYRANLTRLYSAARLLAGAALFCVAGWLLLVAIFLLA